MNTYTAVVIETRSIKVRYTVEAESLEEAEGKMHDGETVDEVDLKDSCSVLGRLIWDPAELVK